MADLFGRQPEDSQPKDVPAVPGQVPLIVEALLNQIRIERPTGQVLVKGRVERLSAWPKGSPRHLFGELVGSDRSIEFRCPIGQGPKAVGDHVVLSGTLTIKPSPIHQGFAVQLVGEVVGSWAPEQPATAPVILERRRGRLPLKHLIVQHGLGSLCLIGSETGLGDARAALLRHLPDAPWREVVCKVADAEAVRERFTQVCRDHAIAGIAFVRGGSDPLTLQIWNDQALLRTFLAQPLPFYTALGHSQELLLADKYSDESFATPSDLGAQAGRFAADLAAETEREQRREQELAKLTERTARAEHGEAVARAMATGWRRRAITLAVALLIGVGLAIAVAVFL
jgi:exodeoxyribonuclease VII large subunit